MKRKPMNLAGVDQVRRMHNVTVIAETKPLPEHEIKAGLRKSFEKRSACIRSDPVLCCSEQQIVKSHRFLLRRI